MAKTLSRKEECDLRLKCLEVMTQTCSRHGIDKGEVYQHAERAFQFVVKTPSQNGTGHPSSDETQSVLAESSL